MKNTICPICVGVSSLWLLMSAGMVWGYLASPVFLVPVALLMGGTVVGIAYLGEKQYRWAARHAQAWKMLVICSGMPLAYFLVTHLANLTIIAEFFLLLIIAYFFFLKRSRSHIAGEASEGNGRIREIEEQMEQCC